MSRQAFVSKVLLLIAALVALGAGVAYADKKVTLCHLPPGNPANPQTISVGEASINPHLRHGDQLGECATDCGPDAAFCDDGNSCTSDACATNGECEHAPVSCEDGDPCTLDSCDESTGCVRLPNDGAPCDDENACTAGDACVGTDCRGSAIAGCCTTSDACDEGDGCTVDSCVEGRCTSQPKDCSVADKCLAGFCDETGMCDTTPVSCDDGNVCTDDFCDIGSGCFWLPAHTPPEEVETSCNDGVDNDCDGAVDAADPDCFVCGDGVVQPPEQCDDGNSNPVDGCDNECLLDDDGAD